MHKISDEIEFWSDQTTDYGVSCLEQWGKCCLHASLFIFDRIMIKVAGNQDKHKNSDVFDSGRDHTTLELLAFE